MSDSVLVLTGKIVKEQFNNELKPETRKAIFEVIQALYDDYGVPIDTIDHYLTEIINVMRNEYGD